MEATGSSPVSIAMQYKYSPNDIVRIKGLYNWTTKRRIRNCDSAYKLINTIGTIGAVVDKTIDLYNQVQPNRIVYRVDLPESARNYIYNLHWWVDEEDLELEFTT